jgi:phosphoribosylpyrophosphate synthetase
LQSVELKTFANGEVYCRYEEIVRGADLFIVQSCAGVGKVNAYLWSSRDDQRRETGVGEAGHGRDAVVPVLAAGRSRRRASRSRRDCSQTPWKRLPGSTAC